MNNIFAYERISTKEEKLKQKYDRQDKAIYKYCELNKLDLAIDPFRDDCSGKDFNRPAWNKLLKIVSTGDTIIFKDVSRFTRERDNGLNMYLKLMNDGINLIFIDNSVINTDYIKHLLDIAASQNEMIVNETLKFITRLLLLAELDRVEKERLIFIQRVKDGLTASGKKSGRPFGVIKLTDELKDDIKAYLVDRSITAKEIIKRHNITYNTFYKYIDLVKKETES